MVAEIYASLSAFKTMFDMAKGLKDINDAAIRNTTIVELSEKILAARESQSALLERVRELEAELADLKAWGAEKQNYQLTAVTPQAFAYVPKPTVGTTEPPHWLCATCYQAGKKSLLYDAGPAAQSGPDSNKRAWKCYSCPTTIRVYYNINPGKPNAAQAQAPT